MQPETFETKWHQKNFNQYNILQETFSKPKH